MDTTDENGSSMMSLRYKIVFVGDVSVGKTSVMKRLISGEFEEAYDPTIGVDFANKVIEFRENTIKLQMWDSAGQEKYKSLIPSYVRGSSLIFILYDVSRKETFDNLKNWINFIKENNTDNSLLVLVGNKIDLTREVNTEQGVELAKKEHMKFFEVSAKTIENIMKMFFSCIAELPFFEQVELNDKSKIIDELETNNRNLNEQNSIYDIVKGKDSNLTIGNRQENTKVKKGKKKNKNCNC